MVPLRSIEAAGFPSPDRHTPTRRTMSTVALVEPCQRGSLNSILAPNVMDSEYDTLPARRTPDGAPNDRPLAHVEVFASAGEGR
jgi:hypothetical protein